MTSQKQTSLFTKEQLMYYQEDSLVNHTQVQESDLGKPMKDISFHICYDALKRSNPNGLLAKMFVDLLVGMGEWYSTKCAMTWKGKAMKSKRFLFQLQVSELDIKDKEFGLLPTPNAQDWNTGVKIETYQKRKQKHLLKGVVLQKSLRQMAADLTKVGQSTRKLKVSFVEEMMGFPINWTVLPFLNGEMNQSKPTETQ
jgi:hypothetical protein